MTIRLRDHYFIAWLNVVKGKTYKIVGNDIFVDMNKDDYTVYLDEYRKNTQPVLKRIRSVVKELCTLQHENTSTSEKKL